MGGLEDEKLWRGLGRAGSWRPLLIHTESRASPSSASSRRNFIKWTGVIACCGPHLLVLENKARAWVASVSESGPSQEIA